MGFPACVINWSVKAIVCETCGTIVTAQEPNKSTHWQDLQLVQDNGDWQYDYRKEILMCPDCKPQRG